MTTLTSLTATPIRLYPGNPRYFEYKGEPLLLVTSAEHYGAVINLDFDYKRYLDALHDEGMNYTRVFVGPYVEGVGSFGIKNNSLAPKPGRFIAPWKRSAVAGYAFGGDKFDLDLWDNAFFERLKDFVGRAEDRDIIVEITPFTSIYTDEHWELSPFHPDNNINGTEAADRRKLHNLPVAGHNLLPYQEALVRKLVRELNVFDNIFFEIQNEPWADNIVDLLYLLPLETAEKPPWESYVHGSTEESLAWQRHFSRLIEKEESELPKQHLIAQNFCNFKYPLKDVGDEIAVLNFHYALPEAAYWNHGWNRVIGYDESGFCGHDGEIYRKQAWRFLLSGGGLYNNLDYSFVAGFEDGSFDNAGPDGGGPGGGSKQLRGQLRILREFLHSFDFVKMAPDRNLIAHSPGLFARGLVEPGTQYAVYIEGSGPAEVRLNIPEGSYHVEWVDVESGNILREETVHSGKDGMDLVTPAFESDIALKIRK